MAFHAFHTSVISVAVARFQDVVASFRRITVNPETILFLPGKSAFDKLPEWLPTNRYL
jgi:hypothetical protein